jgi:Glycosyltransferase family 87
MPTLFHRVMRVVAIVLLCTAAPLVIGGYASSHPFVDFGEYWSAGHLLVAHKSPYSLPEMYQIERSLGWNEKVPDMFLCPPWVFGLVVPLGFVSSYALAWLVWVASLTSLVALSSHLLMDLYFGELRVPEISDTVFHRCLFAFTFYPVLLCLKFAQLSPILLTGIAGFLYFDRKCRPIVAGVFLSLTLIKPHLLYLVWIAVALRSYQQRQVKTILSSATVLAAFTGIGLSLDHQAFRHYWGLTSGPYPQIIFSGVLGIIRRLFDGRDTYWLQTLPPLAGAIWFATFWRKHRNDWRWAERMPALVTASVLTSVYGWVHDQTLLIIPIIALAAKYSKSLGRLPGNQVVLYTGLNICILLTAIISTQAAFIPAPVLIAVLLLRNTPTPPLKNCAEIVATT